MSARTAFVLSLCLAGILSACSTAVEFSKGPYQERDDRTAYHVDDTPTGFVLTVKCSGFQFFPELGAAIAECKSSLTSLAYEIAAQRRREIQPVNDQQIRVSTGRSLGGMTYCNATAPVTYR